MNLRPSADKFSFWLLLLVGCALSAIGCYLTSQYSVPVNGQGFYFLGVKDGCLYWHINYYQKQELFALDIASGQISRAPSWRPNFWARNSRGQQFVVDSSGMLQVIDERNGNVLLSGEKVTTQQFHTPMLIGDNYLVALDFQNCLVHRVEGDPVSDPPLRLNRLSFPGIIQASGEMATSYRSIGRSNRFLLHLTQGKTQSRIYVFELQGDQLNLVISWPTTSDTEIHISDQHVYTAAPNSAAVEIRKLSNLHSVERRAFPRGLSAWISRHRVRNQVAIENGLFSFSDSTGKVQVHRLDDFSPVPELTLPVTEGGTLNDRGDFRRYVLSSEFVYGASEVTVYDTLERRVVLSRPRPRGVDCQGFLDNHAAFVTGERGLTLELIDLETGATQRLQPVAWVLVAMPVLLCLSLAWAIVWIRTVRKWPNWFLPCIFILVALFVLPQLVHAWLYPNSWFVLRPVLMFAYGTLLVLLVFLSLYVVYGRQRVMLRSIPVWLFIAGVLGLANGNINHKGVRGLVVLEPWPANSIVFLVLFPLVTIAFFMGLRSFRCRLHWQWRDVLTEQSRQVLLQDFFLLTACFAACVAAIMPNLKLLGKLPTLASCLGGSLLVTILILPGLLALSPTPRVVRTATALAIVLALSCIAVSTLSFWLGQWHESRWYIQMVLGNAMAFLFVVTFSIGSILRLAGYSFHRV